MRRVPVLVFLLAIAGMVFCLGCGKIKGMQFPYIASPRVVVYTPTSPASGNISVIYQLIDRELEQGTITLEYSTDGGQTYNTATLTVPGEATNLASAWHPGETHTVTWDSVTDMVGRSGAVSVCVKITPSDALNPSGTAGISGFFTVNNIAYNQPPTATVATPAGVQTGNVPINYLLADVESDTCLIAVLYSTNDGTSWQAATMGPAGDGVSGLSSSPSGTTHVYLWNSRADNVAPSGQLDTVRIRITPTDFNAGTVGDTNSFSVDNSVANDPPTVTITGGPADGSTVTTTQVTFTWNGSDTDGSVIGYYYSFDHDPPDIWTTNTTVTSGALSEASHTFRLVAVDDQFDLSIVALRTFTVSLGTITADFSGSPLTGTAPLTVNFTDLSTATNGITSWSWDFGDSGTSSAQNPQHEYSGEGTFTVSLTVTGPDGSDTKTKTSYITVTSEMIEAQFTASPTIGFAPLSVSFTNQSTSSSGITSWSWDFGDGGTSSMINPNHWYSNGGFFTVSLTVFGPDGSDTETKTSYITVTSQGVDTIYVDDLGGDDGRDGLSWATSVQTIQTGLDKASSGWTVLVANGTYTGTSNKNLDFAGMAIHLKSVGGATNCRVDCENSGRGFFFDSGETSSTIVEGFTIQNGSMGSAGGIYCYYCSPTIRKCIITGNVATGFYGGGIYCYHSDPTIANCTISNNTAPVNFGGGVYCDSSSPTISNCTIVNNTADTGGGVFCWWSSNPTITNCAISGNSATMYYGGGIYSSYSCPTLINCLISENTATSYGGGMYCYDGADLMAYNCTIVGNSADMGGGICSRTISNPKLYNTMIWSNTSATSGMQIYTYTMGTSVTLNNCDYADNSLNSANVTGFGLVIEQGVCIYLDPLFVSPSVQNYRLQAGSPCVGAGDNSLIPSGMTTDLDGNDRIVNGTVDMGAYEYGSTHSWKQRNPADKPSARSLLAMAYDSGRGVVVLFGGYYFDGTDSHNYSDTWEWDGNNWTDVSPSGTPGVDYPTPRCRHAMAYDSARGVVVLFGGLDGSYCNDTWEWNGASWMKKSPTDNPGMRGQHAMAYDSDRSVTVLFGGGTSGGEWNDTWEWDGVNWVERFPATEPKARYAHAMVYDSKRKVAVLHGGFAGTFGPSKETWEWDGTNWTQQYSVDLPAVEHSQAMAYDSTRGITVLFGGWIMGSGSQGETWEWNGSTWRFASLAGNPPARYSHAMCYDSGRGVVVLFGGSDSPSYFDDIWEY